jgi:iron complex transport system substrate-binding protein
MLNPKFRFVLVAALFVSILLAACSAPAQPTVAPAQPTAAPAKPSAAPVQSTVVPAQSTAAPAAPTAAPATGPIVVTDALGRTIKFDKPPQRLVLTGKAFFMVMDALYLFPEASQRVVGLPDTTQSKTDFYPVIDTNRAGKTIFQGNEVGPEQILPTKPDVVIMKSTNAAKLGKTFEQVNVPVVYVDFELPEQYTRDLTILGQLLGNADRAKKIDAYYKAQVDRVTGKTKNLKDADKPQVLLLQYAEKSGTTAFSVPPADWMQTLIVEMAGGRPIWKQASGQGGWTIVNLEQIAAWNPDQVYIINYGGNSKDVIAKLKTDPKWQSLKAIKDNKVYGFPGEYYTWDQPDTRWGLGLIWLATKIQPTLFGDVNINQEINQFYALYGLDQAAVQSKVTPLLQGDLP